MDDSSHTQRGYRQALDYLQGFINYEKKMTEQYAAEKMDPTRPKRLLGYLGDPQRQYPTIHIAGTKGKGSVAAICAAALRAAGLRVGLYTSPHLQELRERIRVLTPTDADGRIPAARLADLVGRLPPAVAHTPDVTWFELLTALAFLHFAEEAVDVAVVEVGLGGRLDATNVITPLVSVITRLGLDHTELLGDTLAEIAAEKGGIIKPGVPVVSAPQAPEALGRLEAIAREQGAPLQVVGRDWVYEDARKGDADEPGEWITITHAPQKAAEGVAFPAARFHVALTGSHQQENAVVALAALHQARLAAPSRLAALDLAALQQGLAGVHWPGRLQTLYQGPQGPTLLADGAHNGEAAARLAQALRERYRYRRLWLVVGTTLGKDIGALLQPLLPLAAGVFATRAEHPRAAPLPRIVEEAAALGYEVEATASLSAAVRAARAVAGPEDLICVTGSLFVVGDLLNQWEALKSELF
ncbi:MAG: Mur ligase family protein [Candidatus Promineifilaceae bacterium]|nr:Mur ligase family protein [Candidatus Promineifilaceae bacterium]